MTILSRHPLRSLLVIGLLPLLGCANGRFVNPLARKDEPSTKLKLGYAQLNESQANYKEARKWYEDVLKREPKNAEAVLGIARLDLQADRYSDAEKNFERALKLDPQNPVILDNVGQFHLDQQHYDQAVTCFENALQASPHDKTYRYHYALALSRVGRIEEALPHYSESVGPAAAHYNIGLVYHEQGRINEAEQEFLQAVMKDPNLKQAQSWLDAIRKDRDNQVAITPSQTTYSFQQVANSQETNGAQPRPAIVPHQSGYEELPPPPDDTLSPISQVAAARNNAPPASGPIIRPGAWNGGQSGFQNRAASTTNVVQPPPYPGTAEQPAPGPQLRVRQDFRLQ